MVSGVYFNVVVNFDEGILVILSTTLIRTRICTRNTRALILYIKFLIYLMMGKVPLRKLGTFALFKLPALLWGTIYKIEKLFT